MTLQDVKDVMLGYDAILSNRGIIVQRHAQHATLAHVRWMTNALQDWPITLDNCTKALRWLGFVQGVLVANNVFTIEDVKEHSRTRQVGACVRGRATAKVVAIA